MLAVLERDDTQQGEHDQQHHEHRHGDAVIVLEAIVQIVELRA